MKIKQSKSMMAARVMAVMIFVVSVVLFLLSLVPSQKNIIRFDEDTGFKESTDYSYTIKAVQALVSERSVDEIKSISFVKVVEDGSLQSITFKIKYSKGQEEEKFYYRAGYTFISRGEDLPGHHFVPGYKFTFGEASSGAHSTNSKMLLLSFLPYWSGSGVYTYDSEELDIILNDARGEIIWP